MANRIPCYYLAPTWDFPPPPAGPVKLGSVITNLDTPDRPLFTASIPVVNDPGQVFSTEQRHVTYSTDKLRQGQLGLFARFLGLIIGVGVDATVDWEKTDTSLFTFDTLETTQLIPSPELTQTCISAPSVARFLEKSRYRKPVYIITGLKTAKGVQAKTLSTRSAGTGLKAEANGLLLADPVTVGPTVSGDRTGSQSVAWESGSDFVFAFRVRKVVVKKKTGGVKSDEDYIRGAMLDKESDPGTNELGFEVVFDGEVDVVGEGLGYEELLDGEELVWRVKLAGREEN